MGKYYQLMKLSFINRLDYRQELFMSLFIGIIIFIGQTVFWWAVFDGKEIVNGFTFSQILAYYLFARIVSEVIDSKVGFRVSELILSGQVSSFLLKPVVVPAWLFFQEVGQMIVDIFIKTGVYVIIFILLFKSLDVAIGNIPIFLLSIFLSLLISFSLFLLTGCVAFWTDNATSMNYALRRIILFLAGGIVPLAFFPVYLQKILYLLPFSYMFDLPIKILTAKINYSVIMTGISIQLIWACILWVLVAYIFSVAVKNNESVGI